jgi:hypothetical protein
MAVFYEAAEDINKIGLSFGGGDNLAVGCGVNGPSAATFQVLDFVDTKK